MCIGWCSVLGLLGCELCLGRFKCRMIWGCLWMIDAWIVMSWWWSMCEPLVCVWMGLEVRGTVYFQCVRVYACVCMCVCVCVCVWRGCFVNIMSNWLNCSWCRGVMSCIWIDLVLMSSTCKLQWVYVLHWVVLCMYMCLVCLNGLDVLMGELVSVAWVHMYVCLCVCACIGCCL